MQIKRIALGGSRLWFICILQETDRRGEDNMNALDKR